MLDPLLKEFSKCCRSTGNWVRYAFNMAIVFGRETTEDFSAFCSLISRINPNPLSTSDSAFMERLHNEPIILTLPEDLGRYYRNESR